MKKNKATCTKCHGRHQLCRKYTRTQSALSTTLNPAYNPEKSQRHVAEVSRNKSPNSSPFPKPRSPHRCYWGPCDGYFTPKGSERSQSLGRHVLSSVQRRERSFLVRSVGRRGQIPPRRAPPLCVHRSFSLSAALSLSVCLSVSLSLSLSLSLLLPQGIGGVSNPRPIGPPMCYGAFGGESKFCSRIGCLY